MTKKLELAAKKIAGDDDTFIEGYSTTGATKLVDKLNKKVGTKVTIHDFAAWMGEGDKGNSDRFDKAVVKLLGQDARDEGEQLARLENLLLYALGMGEDKVGGISMKAILQGAKKTNTKSAKPAKDNSPKIKEIKAAMRKLSQMKSVKTYIGLAKKLQKLQG